MPALIKKKKGSKIYWYIIENQGTKRKYLQSLGAIKASDAKILLGRYQEAGDGGVTLAFAFERFEEYFRTQINKNIQQGTFNLHKWYARRVVELLGHILIRDLTFEDIEWFKTQVGARVANRTINLYLTEIRRVLEWSVKQKWIKTYPKLQRVSEAKPDAVVESLTREQVATLLKFATGQQRFYIQLMIYTGMRPKEANDLTWDNIGPDYIDIISSNPKKSGRRIPLHPELKKAIGSQKVTSKTDKVSPYASTLYANRAMRRLRRSTEITVNPYILRKTAASWLAQAGVEAYQLTKIMGHSSLETTMKYYMRLDHQDLATAMGKI